jgi:signal transduction histidine kinase
MTAGMAAGPAGTGSTALRQADLLSGVTPDNLVNILVWVTGAVVVTAILGAIVLRIIARRSVGLHVGLVAAVCVITAMITTGEIATIMLSPGDRVVMLELIGISGIASLVVSLIVGRSIGRASKALLSSVQQVGESGIYTPPDRELPAELAGLSAGLTEAHEKLGQSRARQQALEASRRELVAWVSHDLRTPLAGLRAMAEALEDQVVTDPREVSHYHSQIRVETERLLARP